MAITPLTEKTARRCACGCGETFIPRRRNHRYVSPAHRMAYHRRSTPAIRLTEPRIRRMMEAALAAAMESE